MPRRGFGLFEVVIIAGLMGLFGSFAVPRVRRAAEYMRYRSAIDEVVSLVRMSRHHAMVQRQAVELRIDAPHRMFQLVNLETRLARTERVERTVWLPEGLEITDAPAALAVPPSGDVPVTQIVIAAPAYHRNFRLITHRTGPVELHEEPAL